jgi:hypothetical protein
MGMELTVRRAVTPQGLAGYIADVALLLNSRNYVRELMENAMYIYEGSYDKTIVKELTGFYTDLEKVIREKGKLVGVITRAERLWDAFIMQFPGKGVMSGTMELNFKHRAIEFYINVVPMSAQGQLPATSHPAISLPSVWVKKQ